MITLIVNSEQKQPKPDLVPYVEAFNSSRVKESPDSEILVALNGSFYKAVFNLGQQPKSEEDVEMMCRGMLPDVKLFFGNLTLNELQLAAHKGSLGQYGEFFGVNIATITGWFNAYMGDMKRQEAKKLLIPAEPQKEKVLSDDQKKELALTAFEKFKVSGNYDDWGNLVYNFLESKEVITLSNERKKQLLEAVKVKEIERLKHPQTLDEKRSFDREILSIMEGKTDLRSKCKRHALNVFFGELVEMDQQLSDLI